MNERVKLNWLIEYVKRLRQLLTWRLVHFLGSCFWRAAGDRGTIIDVTRWSSAWFDSTPWSNRLLCYDRLNAKPYCSDVIQFTSFYHAPSRPREPEALATTRGLWQPCATLVKWMWTLAHFHLSVRYSLLTAACSAYTYRSPSFPTSLTRWRKALAECGLSLAPGRYSSCGHQGDCR